MLPGILRELLARLGEHLKEHDRQVDALEAKIQDWHRENTARRSLAQIPYIGPLTASALVATIGDAKSFNNACQSAAWLGLIARQHSISARRLTVFNAMHAACL